MKKFLFTLVTLFLSVTAFAQSALIATLSHGDSISVYYGANALRDAHTAATDGDIITLSSGTFISTDISKAITLRGAGMLPDSALQILPTIIAGDFYLSAKTDTTPHRLTIEGIYHNDRISIDLKIFGAQFIKCRLSNLTYSSSGSKLLNSTFIHCQVTKNMALPGSTFTMISCVAKDIDISSGYAEMKNCIIINTRATNDQNLSCYNCILYNNHSNYSYAPMTAYNCIGYGNSKIFENITNTTNKILKTDTENIFKTYKFTTNLSDGETYELTEEAKKKYFGMDGTEVGIYGGSFPYDITPTNPRIVKCNVASKSTADGKLSVDIEVKAAE